MSSSAYKKIKKDLNSWNKDVMFPISLLDELEEQERREIEKEIISMCLNGVYGCNKFLSYIKYSSVIDIFTLENMSRLPINAQGKILERLFLDTNNTVYLNRLLVLSTESVDVYFELVLMYYNNKYNEKIKDKVFDILKSMALNNPKYGKKFKFIDPSIDVDLKDEHIKEEIPKDTKKITVTLKTITGEPVTQKTIDAIKEYNKQPHHQSIGTTDIYYEKDNQLIKYVTTEKQAYVLIHKKWRYSQEYTNQINMDSNSIPRKYNVYENYPYEKDMKAIFDDNITYIEIYGKTIAKVDNANCRSYIFDPESKTWREELGIYVDYVHGNVVAKEIPFDDIYPIGEPWKYPNGRGL